MLFGKQVIAIKALRHDVRVPCAVRDLAICCRIEDFACGSEETAEVALVVALGRAGNRVGGGQRGCSARLLAWQDELAGANSGVHLSSLPGLRNQALIR